jgi:hypothetical protein
MLRSAVEVTVSATDSAISITETLRRRSNACSFCVPPERGTASAVDIDLHLARPAGGLAHIALVRKAHVDPQLDGAREVALHEIGLVLRGEAAPEFEALVGVQRECQQPHHHSLVGLRRMAGDGQRVRREVVAVEVGDLQLRLEDRGLQGHAGSWVK